MAESTGLVAELPLTREVAVEAAAPPRAIAARQEYVDGVRALAALWVVLHHAIETSEPERALKLPVFGPILASLFFGQFPVMIFLMLSGFCLYYPFAKKGPKPDFPRGWPAFFKYMKRRAQRIAPPYYITGAFCLVMAAFPALSTGRWKEVATLEPAVILSHLVFVHNLIPDHATKIDYPMWSIGLEWQLYLVFPLLVMAFRRVGPLVVIGVCTAIAAVIRVTYRGLPELPSSILRNGPFAYLEIFCIGMLVAALTVEKRVPVPRWVLGAGVVAGFAVVRLGSGNGLAHDLATSVAAFGLLLLASDPTSSIARTLSTPWLVKIGFFSYSLYLVHAPLLHLAWLAVKALQLSGDATFVVLVALVVPLIVIASYGFHVLFERPFMVKKS